MKKIVLVGRSECGKTTLTQALKGEKITYYKTQYINNYDVVIDTPGEYAQTKSFGHALALYAYEADVVGILISATENYSLFPPNITCLVNREVIGIVTKVDAKNANVAQARKWLQLTGCKEIFEVNSLTGEGVDKVLMHLKEEGDKMPWE